MNLEKWSFGAALVVTALAVSGLAACEGSLAPMAASPVAQVIATM